MPESHLSGRLQAALGLEVLHRLLGMQPKDAVYRQVLPMVAEGLLENGYVAARIGPLEVCSVWVLCRSDERIAGRYVNNVLGVSRAMPKLAPKRRQQMSLLS